MLANTRLKDSDWRGELLKDDPPWLHRVPPTGNANLTCVSGRIYWGRAPATLLGFVLANSSVSSVPHSGAA